MRLSGMLTAWLLAYLLTATAAHALITSYGKREIAEAGSGCVGGSISDHGNTAYFCGNTEMLNEQLALLSKGENRFRSFKVVLHAGVFTIDDLGEEPREGSNQPPNQISVDWSVCKSCRFDKVAKGLCQCDERDVTVDIWVANDIRLSGLIVPANFHVGSAGDDPAGDIEEFVKSHSVQSNSGRRISPECPHER